MNGGWRYSVDIPSWTQASLEAEDSVVFYRIEVSIMPPEHHGDPRTRSVLRRFSHFQKLQRMLKEELGKDAVAAPGLAPRWTPFSVSKKPEAVEKRRRELEAWLWKLIAEPRTARSRVLNQFLELTDAARMARSPQPSAAGDVRPPLMTSPGALRSGSVASAADFAASEDAMSEFDDTGSDTSFLAAGTCCSSSAGGDPHHRSAASDPFPPHPGEAFGGSGSGGFGGGGREAPGGSPAGSAVTEMRLGLRVEHRGNIRRLVRMLRERLERASHDLQDAVETMRTDQETKRGLFERVTTLEAQLAAAQPHSGPRASPAVPPGSDAELASLLAAERQRTLDLQKALQDESGRITELQGQLAAQAAQRPAGPTAAVQGEALASQQEAAAGVDVAAAAPDAPDAATAGQAEPDSQLREAQAALQAARMQLADAEAQNRAKQKLLAKEVKSLRQQLAEARAAAAAAPSEAAPAADGAAAAAAPAAVPALAEGPAAVTATAPHRVLLAEVAALRQRLADCAVESMTAASESDQQQQDGGSLGAPGEQLLQTSDDRIQALAAEAALLANNPGTWSDEERQIRAAFATVLQENAQLHKAVNAALRASQPPAGGAAASSTQAQPRQDGGGGHSVFSRFSGALANDRGHQKPAAGASPPKDGSATFADFKSRLSNRFKSASSSEAPPDSSKQDAV